LPPVTEKGHGRIEVRDLKAAPIEAEACGFPHARQVAEATRRLIDPETGETAIDPKTGKEKTETRHFIISLGPEAMDPAGLARLIRGHWSVENRNHWKRDASQWREDACRLRRPKAAQNFALLRNTLLALIPPKLKPMIVAFEHYSRHLAAAIKLLNSKLPAEI